MKKKKTENKKQYWKLAIVGSLFLCLLIIIGFIFLRDQNITLIAIAIIVLALAGVFVAKRLKSIKDVKKGLTLEDERSRKVLLLTGAKAFQISIWYILILMWLSSVLEIVALEVEMALGLSIVGMAVIFGITWLWANKQEDLDKTVRF
jgi:uncharacterized membrane protein